MTDLHVTNGDGAANLLKASVLPGDVLPWRDPMHHGPFPADLDLDDLSTLRANYLASKDASDVARDFKLRDAHLRAAGKYDRVVLWFEHDLLDQLQILQLLDWFARTDLGDTRLELICIDRFSGMEPFRGLGQLDPDQLASLYGRRQPVTAAQLDLAKAGWSAFRSPDPRDLFAFMATDLRPLPFLHEALTRHLEDYPWFETGLTRTERQILTLAASGVQAPGQLFLKNMELETVLFIGDWRTFSHIAQLCAGSHPLLHCDPGGEFHHPPDPDTSREAFRSQKLRITDIGKRILSGGRDAFDLIHRDQFLGGVHLLTGKPMWTWDAARNNLTLREP